VFTVLEALVLQKKGRIRLEDDIRDYVEEFRLFDNARDSLPLRALGSHLSGLGRDGSNPSWGPLI
jgi:CubicO group peptidase (beta-lactamase class C family)